MGALRKEWISRLSQQEQEAMAAVHARQEVAARAARSEGQLSITRLSTATLATP